VPQGFRLWTARFHAAEWLAFGLAALLMIRIVRPVVSAKRAAPVVSESLYNAGLWARANLPPGCVDYLVGQDFTAYWLHLAVLGNPRMSSRTGNNETFESQAAIIRWLTPGGLPYAVAELPALPRDVRNELDVMASFGDAAVVRRRGPASCAEASAPRSGGRIG
jgi:hypothetical protein